MVIGAGVPVGTPPPRLFIFLNVPMCAKPKEADMPFLESPEDYADKMRRFMDQHPEASADDLAALFPKMNNATAIWARFNASAKRHRGARAGSKTAAE